MWWYKKTPSIISIALASFISTVTLINAQPLIIAHRGASGLSPENTLASVKKALDIGVDMIEVDVHLTKDSVPVVIHDRSLKRTTSINKKVNELTSKEIKQLSAGSWFNNDFKDEKIPLLSEVITLVNNRCKLLIEIKNGSKVYPNIEQIVLRTIKELSAQHYCYVHIFSQTSIYTWNSFNSQIPVSSLKIRTPLKIGFQKLFHTHPVSDSSTCYNHNYYYFFVTKHFVKKIHHKEQRIMI